MKDISITLALRINACAILTLAAAVVGQGSSDRARRTAWHRTAGRASPTAEHRLRG